MFMILLMHFLLNMNLLKIDKNIKTINQNNTVGVIICKKDNNTVLKLYDAVVVKGRNLYDGKIVG